MKKLFTSPVFALLVSILLVLGSGMLSSRLRIAKIASLDGIDAAAAEYEEYRDCFPGNIFLKLSGF